MSAVLTNISHISGRLISPLRQSSIGSVEGNGFLAGKVLLNCLIIFSLIPATEQVRLYQYIYYNKISITNIYYEDDNPYIIAGLNPKLYTHYLPEINKFNTLNTNENFYLITRDQLTIDSLSNIKCIKEL